MAGEISTYQAILFHTRGKCKLQNTESGGANVTSQKARCPVYTHMLPYP